MSRYAAVRPGEPVVVFPGEWKAVACSYTWPLDAWERLRYPEDVRRMIAAKLRRMVLEGYERKRAGTLDGPSWQWEHPPGRVRYRWVRQSASFGDLLVLHAVVYPKPALDRHTEGVPA